VATFGLWPLTVADHSAAYEITQKALHFAEHYYETEFYLYETSIGGQSNQFKPDVYVNVSDVMDRKLEILAVHSSQVSVATGEFVKQQSRFRGREARVDYAEAFCSVHALVNTRWGRRAGCLLLDL
jgi:LmbE family N-acetylglucosaminyl deacetylase